MCDRERRDEADQAEPCMMWRNLLPSEFSSAKPQVAVQHSAGRERDAVSLINRITPALRFLQTPAPISDEACSIIDVPSLAAFFSRICFIGLNTSPNTVTNLCIKRDLCSSFQNKDANLAHHWLQGRTFLTFCEPPLSSLLSSRRVERIPK